jgi:hypothetical protein
MDYKANEKDWMAYLYGELEGREKEDFERFLAENAEARQQLEQLKQVRTVLSAVEDKEVIAPPIFVGDHRRQLFWNAPYFKSIVGIAASLLIVILVGKLTALQVRYSGNQLNISFGTTPHEDQSTTPVSAPTLTPQEVQGMINASLDQRNQALQTGWVETQQKLDASVKQNLARNSAKIDHLLRESSAASQDQIRQFVSGLQTENMEMVKNYFQLTTKDQKQYIESLLVDFAKYLQQQRNDDLQVVQTQLNSIQQNTDSFKQETEQILTSIISTVGDNKSLGTKN